MSDEKLKPCPFCGGRAETLQIGNEVTPKRGFEVKCMTWGCATKKRAMVIRQPIEKAKGYAIKAWNARSEPPAVLKAVREALEPVHSVVATFPERWYDSRRLEIVDATEEGHDFTAGDLRRAAEVYAALNLSETVDE